MIDETHQGIFRRIVKSPVEAVGSPSSTANCAPGRTTGGAGPQEWYPGECIRFVRMGVRGGRDRLSNPSDQTGHLRV